MAAINFPSGASNGATHYENGKLWTYDGTSWTIVSNPVTLSTPLNVSDAGSGSTTLYLVGSNATSGSGIAFSTDSSLTYNPNTNLLSINSGSFAANGVTIGSASNTINTASGNLTLDSVGGTVNINDNLIVTGDLTVNGSTTTVNSTVTSIVDPIIVLGSGAGNTHPSSDDNKDRGIEFRYVSGTAKTGFFGFDDSTGKFTFIPDGSNTSEVFSGSAGTAVFATVEADLIGTATTSNYAHQSGYAITSGTATTTQNIQIQSASTNTSHRLVFTPDNSASGVALSTNTTLVYNPSTDILSVSGLAVTSSLASVSPTTGALIVTGGVGIGDSLFTSPSSPDSISGVILSNSVITSGSWAGSTITSRYGGTGFSTFNKGDLLVGDANSYLNRLPVGDDRSVLIGSSYSGFGLSWQALLSPTYGSFASTESQVVSSSGTTVVRFNTTYEANRVSITPDVGTGNTTRIYIQDSGTYNFQFSAQNNLLTTNQSKNGEFWFRINGVDVAESNSRTTIIQQDAETILSLNFIYTIVANSFIELVMYSDTADFGINSFRNLTLPTRPDIPSIIFTVVPVSNILPSGATGITGLASLNAQTGSIQTFAVGQAGDDFNISSGLNVHTFNIPNAGISTVRGLITNSAQSIAGSKTFTSDLNITSLTASTSTTSGSLVAFGGLGLSGNAFIGGTVTAPTFFGNLSGLAVTAINFYGDLTGNVTGTATTATNVNIESALTNASHSLIFTPTRSSSGSALSANSTLVYNPNTDILTTSGLAVTSGIALTAPSGPNALTVNGGIGASGMYAWPGPVGLGSSTNRTQRVEFFRDVGSEMGVRLFEDLATVARLTMSRNACGSNQPGIMWNNTSSTAAAFGAAIGVPTSIATQVLTIFVTDGTNLNVQRTNWYGGATRLYINEISFGANTSSIATTSLLRGVDATGTDIASGDFIIQGGRSTGIGTQASIRFRLSTPSTTSSTLNALTDVVNINYGQGSTSVSSGALIVYGGVGITGNAFIGGTVTITNSSGSGSSTSGALVVNGGLGISGDTYVGRNLDVRNTATIRSLTSGRVTFAGANGLLSDNVGLTYGTGTSSLTVQGLGSTSQVGLGFSNAPLTISKGIPGNVFFAGLGDIPVQTQTAVGLRLNNPNTPSNVTHYYNAPFIELVSKNGTNSRNTSRIRFNTYGTPQGSDLTSTFSIDYSVGTNTDDPAAHIWNGMITGTGYSNPVLATALTRDTLVLRGDTTISGAAWTSPKSATSSSSAQLVVNGGVGITGNAIIGGTFGVIDSTGSTSSSTGALVVSGGAGFGKSINVGGNIGARTGFELRAFNPGDTNYSSFKYTGSTDTPYTLPTSYPSTGTSILQSDTSGTLTWVPMTSGGGAGTVNNGLQYSIPYYPSSGTLVTGSSNFTNVGTGISIIYPTSNSTSTTTGALVVSGGVGITGKVNIGGIVNITDTTDAVPSGSPNGALQVTGGATIGGTLVVNSILTVGGKVNYSVTNVVAQFVSNVNSYSQTIFHNENSGNNASTDIVLSNNLSTDIATFGDLGINSSGWADTTAAFNTANATYLASNNGDLALGSLTANDIRFFYNNGLSDIVTLSGSGMSVYFGTNSTSTTTGAINVRGGVGITGNAFIGGTVTIVNSTGSGSSTSGALVVNGGVGVSGNIYSGRNIEALGTGTFRSLTSGRVTFAGTNGLLSDDANFQYSTTTDTLTLDGANAANPNLLITKAIASLGITTPGIRLVNSTIATAANNLFSPTLELASGTWAGSAFTARVKFQSNGSSADGVAFNITYSVDKGSSNFSRSFISAFGDTVNNSSGYVSVATNQLRVLPYATGSSSYEGLILGVDTDTVADVSNNYPSPSFVVIGNEWNGTDPQNIQARQYISSGSSISSPVWYLDLGHGYSIDRTPQSTNYTNAITARRFGPVSITQAIGATSTDYAALTVAGGFGLSGSAFIGGTVTIQNTTATTSSTTGALVVNGGAGIAKSLFVGGNISNANYFYSGGNNFTKSGQAVGDIFLDNNTNDTPGILYYFKNNTNFGVDVYATGTGATRYRIVKDLNESTAAEIWSIDRNGVVTRTAWDVGEVINTRVYNNTDLGMSATTTINSTTYTDVAVITYTPKSSTSHLWIEFDAHYDYSNGTTTDDFFSRITVGGSVISEKNQIMVGQVGGGTRSGVIFPISGRYTNSSTSGIAITVQAKWGSADDAIRVYGSSTSGYMRIQEIGR